MLLSFVAALANRRSKLTIACSGGRSVMASVKETGGFHSWHAVAKIMLGRHLRVLLPLAAIRGELWREEHFSEISLWPVAQRG